jgi:glycosyltransferase involved in cell wall biosynthesis
LEETSGANGLPSLSVIVCAYNEERYLAACLHSLLAQTRPPDEIIVVDNASTDRTGAIAESVPAVRVVREHRKGLVRARETGRRHARGDVLVYLDADCRAPLYWLQRLEETFVGSATTIAVTGPYRYYDWDRWGRVLIRSYDLLVAPLAHVIAQDVLQIGAILYGGNFAVRQASLEQIGGFDTRIDFHGEDTNLARRLAAIGRITVSNRCFLYTSARRYTALGRGHVFRVYVRNFWSELIHHRPADITHQDVGR